MYILNFNESSELSDLTLVLNQILSEIKSLKENSTLKKTWIDSKAVMSLLCIDTRTLQNYRDTGVLPFSKFGGKIMYKVSDIEEILERNYINIKSLSKGKFTNN